MGRVCSRYGERRGVYRERDHLAEPGVDGRIILRWIIRKWDMGVWMGLRWFRIVTGGGSCVCSNELLGSIKCGNFLTSWEAVSF